jgi:hypothetical protein
MDSHQQCILDENQHERQRQWDGDDGLRRAGEWWCCAIGNPIDCGPDVHSRRVGSRQHNFTYTDASYARTTNAGATDADPRIAGTRSLALMQLYHRLNEQVDRCGRRISCHQRCNDCGV